MKAKWKKIKQVLDCRLFQRKIQSRRKRTLRNKGMLGISRVKRLENQQRNVSTQQWVGYKIIRAPKIFSLLANTEGLLSFINAVDACFKKKKKVFISMRDTTLISHDAIVVLLSKLIQFKTSKIDFNGDFPRDVNSRWALNNSGFFEHLYQDIDSQEAYTFNRKIYTHANKNVNSLLSSKIIEEASEKLWQEKRRCPGLQRVFIELMQNTNNHASFHKKGDKYWWASIVHNKQENKVCFSFIDYGVGILDSLKNKESGKFARIINTINGVFRPNNNAEILKLLLEGKIHELIKEQAYNRGKGLPGIMKAWRTNNISNLIIITNDVYANIVKNEYRLINNHLSGTFVYWELNSNNNNIKDE